MSLNSLIQNKIAAKRCEIRGKYDKRTQDAVAAYEKSREAECKKFAAQMQTISDAASAAGIELITERDWSTGKLGFKVSLNEQSGAYQKVSNQFHKEQEAELKKFEGLDERAQLSALLPAKERRDEMAAMLAEIAKF